MLPSGVPPDRPVSLLHAAIRTILILFIPVGVFGAILLKHCIPCQTAHGTFSMGGLTKPLDKSHMRKGAKLPGTAAPPYPQRPGSPFARSCQGALYPLRRTPKALPSPEPSEKAGKGSLRRLFRNRYQSLRSPSSRAVMRSVALQTPEINRNSNPAGTASTPTTPTPVQVTAWLRPCRVRRIHALPCTVSRLRSKVPSTYIHPFSPRIPLTMAK